MKSNKIIRRLLGLIGLVVVAIGVVMPGAEALAETEASTETEVSAEADTSAGTEASSETETSAEAVDTSCQGQGATFTKDYYVYANNCKGEMTTIYQCKRSGTKTSDCKKIAKGDYASANVLEGSFETNYFWVLDNGNANKAGHKHWCLNAKNGKQVADSKCGDLPGFKKNDTDVSTSGQGYAQYGKYYLRGYSNKNRIDVYEGKELTKTLMVGHDPEELQDVMVDGATGTIYFTTAYDGKVNLYEYSGYQLPKYSKIVSHTVTFDLRGLNVKSGKKQIVKEVGYDKTVKAPELNITDKNQVFKYWSKKAGGSTAFNFMTPIKDDLTLYAVWVKADGSGGEMANNAQSACNNLRGTQKKVLGCSDDGDGSSATQNSGLPAVVQGILNGIIGAIGVVAVIFVLIGGIGYMTSNGDATKVDKAKKTILYALIGLVIAALSFAVVNFVIGLL